MARGAVITISGLARFIAFAVMAGAAWPAAAQSVPAGTDMAIPSAASPLGLRAGGFLVYPVLTTTLGYDDNIFSRNTNVVGDATSVIRADLAAKSDWNRHQLNLSGYVIDKRYLKFGDQNNDQYSLHGDGRLDIFHDLTFTATGAYSQLVQERGTPGNVFLAGSPVHYRLASGSAGLAKAFNRVSVSASATLADYTYRNVVLINQVVFNQSYRNRLDKLYTGRVNYAYSALTTVYVTGTLNEVDYRPPPGTIDRSNRGVTVLIGSQFEITRLLHGTIGIGYISRNFRNTSQSSFSGLDYSADVTYQPTLLTTVVLSADRSVNDSGTVQIGGVLTSSFSINVTHELLRNLTLNANLAYNRDKYSVGGISQGRFTSLLSATRRFNSSLNATVSYSRRTQSASIFQPYKENIVSLGIAVFR